jgi:hypothetical protein
MADAYYSNVALPTTLTGSISSGATTISVGATTGFPGSFPYTVALDYGAGTEELVSVTAAAGLNLTVTRGFSGTSAQSHSLGAVVRHVYHAGDATDFRTHQDAATDVHGVTGALVGATQTQTLTNKTLTSPTINSGTLAGGALSGTFTGDPTLSGNPTFSGSVTTTGVVESVRTDSTDNSLGTRQSGDAINRFTARADGQLTWGSGALSRDTNLYRAEANVLATDDTFRVFRGAAAEDALSVRIAGDTASRFLMEADGGMSWSPGTGSQDTSLYRSAAGTLTTGGNFAIGGDLTVGGVGQRLEAVKTADTSRSSVTSVSADAHLTLAVSAGARYVLEGMIFYTSTSTTPDLTLTVEGPAGAAGLWSMTAPSTAVTGDPDSVRVIASDIGSGRTYGVPIGSSVFTGQLAGGLLIGGTAGNVFVSWAQSTSSATATVLKQHSWIRLTRVS